ncbi:MAG: dipeptidase [Pseudomonadota bacterium]
MASSRLTQVPIFDGHNDALFRLFRAGGGPAALFGEDSGHVNIPAAQRGGFAGGFFAMFALGAGRGLDFSIFATPPYDAPLPEPLDQPEALCQTIAQAGIARQLETAGLVRFCTSGADVRRAMQDEVMALVLHLEGAEAIGGDLLELDALYALGLRSLGPVWSRPTIFGHGVPFRFPSDGDIGPGLTEPGKRLVKRCGDLGMVVDNSHLNERGFWDVAELGLPLVATHSNAHHISPSARNLTDEQLRSVGQTDGMVGLNYGTMFLHPDGSAGRKGALDHVIRHLDHMISLAGEDHVGLGSDFDGAPMPEGLDGAGTLSVLRNLMADAGYGTALIEKICHGNWLALMDRVMKAH